MEMRWEKLQVTARSRETPEGKRVAGRKGGVFGPGKRWGHTCNVVRDGRLIYLFGGYGENNGQTNDVHVYDTALKRWSKPITNGVPPIPRDSHTCTTVGTKLFVFGGTDGKSPLRDLHVLDTATNTWTLPVTRGEGPGAREGHGAALVGSKLFIFGGCGKSENNTEEVYYDDLYILDTDDFVWERGVTSGTSPCARDSHTCSSWGKKLIVLGGEDASDSYLSDVYMLDTETMVWRELNTSGQMLTPRAGHSTVVIKDNLLVYGGFTNQRILFSDIFVLNIDTLIWSKVTCVNQIPSPRFSPAADCVDAHSGKVVLIGGCNRKLQALDDMYYLHTGLNIGNDGCDEKQESVFVRKELRRKHLESESDKKSDDASQTGAMLCNLNHSEGRSFEAKVVDRHSIGCTIEYTVETCIDGHLLRGVLFSTSSLSSNNGRYYANKNKRRMGKDNGSKLNDEYPERLNVDNATHQATGNAHQRITDLQPVQEPHIPSSLNMVPVSHFMYSNAMSMAAQQSAMNTVPLPNSMTMVPCPDSKNTVYPPKMMGMLPAYVVVAQPERILQPDSSSIKEEVRLASEHHGSPNVPARELAFEESAAAKETSKLPSKDTEPYSEDDGNQADSAR